MYETIELMLMAACLGICSLLVLHFALMRPVTRKTTSIICMMIVVSGVMATSTIAYEQAVSHSTSLLYIHHIFIALSAPIIAWALLEFFLDDFKLERWQLIFLIVAVPAHFLQCIDTKYAILCHLSSAMIFGYLIYVSIRTKPHDLIEDRLKFRLWFVQSAAILGLFMTLAHWYYTRSDPHAGMPVWLHLFQTFAMLLLDIIFAYWVLNVRTNLWAQPNDAPITNPTSLSLSERSLLQKLQDAMDQQAWQQEGLTIRKLATQLDVPEHRLRKVINQGLGYRNFATYINSFRVQAACELLADPAKVEMPILTIAYDVGYASLGPFNRAFKNIVGESPSEYRRNAFELS